MLKDKSFLFIVLDQLISVRIHDYDDTLINIQPYFKFYKRQELIITLAASIALATVMNCWGETDLSSHRLRKVWSEPDLLFDISTPSSRVRTFHPSSPFPNLFESEADNNSCMQLSLAKCTYLLNESSLMDLHRHSKESNNMKKTNSPIRIVIGNRIKGSNGSKSTHQDRLQGAGLFILGFRIGLQASFYSKIINKGRVYVYTYIYDEERRLKIG